jgi:PPM family protein phosphatase
MKVRIAMHADKGPRENLEDAMGAFTVVRHANEAIEVHGLAGFDGVGGEDYGEVASCIAQRVVEASLVAGIVLATVEQLPAKRDAAIREALKNALAQANEAILRQASENASLRGMSTTAVVALVVGDVLNVAWVGDSRCYLFRQGSIRPLTRDHSEVQKLLDAGLIDPKDAFLHPLAHTITRYLGSPSNAMPETTMCQLMAGDIVLVCTDGLTDVLGDQEIARLIARHQAGEFCFDDLPGCLIQHALDAGATDNVSVLCSQYQLDTALRPVLSGRTLTGAYPVAMAKALHRFAKENCHVQESLCAVEN